MLSEKSRPIIEATLPIMLSASTTSPPTSTVECSPLAPT